jgi:hypothetical protein
MAIDHDTHEARLGSSQNSREERVAASRFVLRKARSREDLHELLDALGLNTPMPREEATGA